MSLTNHTLLINDDIAFQFLNQFLLNKIGIPKENIHTVDNGKDAIDLLSEYYAGTRELPDVIFLD
jgi:hypothetical protein